MRAWAVVMAMAACGCGGSRGGGPAIECPAGTEAADSEYARGCKRNDGTWHGPFVSMHSGGWMQKSGAFRDGVPDGVWKVYTSDGHVLGTYEIVDGNGVVRDWYDSAAKRGEVTYRGGQPDGVARTWYENGQVQSEVTWRAGWQHGKNTVWDERGVKQLEASYDDGRQHGVARFWELGQLVREEEYEHGERVRQTLYQRGAVVSEQRSPVTEPAGKIVTRGHPKVDPAWQACRAHHECDMVSKGCCPCGAGDHVAVHYKHRAAAEAALRQDCSSRSCPQQLCMKVDARCDGGRCATVE